MTPPPFACDIMFTQVSSISDATLAQYGMGTMTDTSEVCAKWTGSDYKVHVTQLGTSESAGETADSTGTVLFENGVVSATTLDGQSLGEPTSVGTSAFDFGQATPNEIAASFAEPWYGVVGSGGGGGGGGTCTPPDCYATIRSGTRLGTAPIGLPKAVASLVVRKEHGVSRPALRELLGDRDERPRAASGRRRFSRLTGDTETIIEIDPSNELVVAQESHSRGVHSRADMKWSKQGGRFVRSLVQLATDDTTNGQPHHMSATIRILSLKLAGEP